MNLTQLHDAIKNGADYFITNDQEIIKKRNALQNIHKIKIRTPEEFQNETQKK